MKRTPIARAPMKRTYRLTGPDALALETVAERDGACCARCAQPVTGQRGVDFHVHHRRPRRAGGDGRPDVNLPSNLVLLHPSCHTHVEAHRAVAYDLGFLLRSNDVPAGGMRCPTCCPPGMAGERWA